MKNNKQLVVVKLSKVNARKENVYKIPLLFLICDNNNYFSVKTLDSKIAVQDGRRMMFPKVKFDNFLN